MKFKKQYFKEVIIMYNMRLRLTFTTVFIQINFNDLNSSE